MNIKIEKGIPIPTDRGKGLKATLRKLAVGESFIYPANRQTSVTGTACFIRQMTGPATCKNFRVVTRKILNSP